MLLSFSSPLFPVEFCVNGFERAPTFSVLNSVPNSHPRLKIIELVCKDLFHVVDVQVNLIPTISAKDGGAGYHALDDRDLSMGFGISFDLCSATNPVC